MLYAKKPTGKNKHTLLPLLLIYLLQSIQKGVTCTYFAKAHLINLKTKILLYPIFLFIFVQALKL